jgi:hypothetical protein
MLIKIKGRNNEKLTENISRVMNIACVVARRGTIPTQYDIETPERRGLYWYINESGDTFELLPTKNDDKAFVRDKGDNFIVVEFFSRYDKEGKKFESLSKLILAFFSQDDVEEVL